MNNDMKTIRDFTLNKYKELCETLLSSGYAISNVDNYLNKKNKQNSLILRHDVDVSSLKYPVRMAELEYDLGIKSTYYFRFVGGVFNPKIIRRIRDLGHEIGYHYEVLSKANGDYEKAVELFEKELNEFRKIIDVKTISMHGSPLSKYDNRDLWKRYDFKEFGIVGEAYLSISSKDINYFSDTGRSWNWKNKMRDFMIDNNNDKELIGVNTTDELINLIKSGRAKRLYILAHPERWTSNKSEWIFSYTKDSVFNVGKKVLMRVRG
jgi:hypothetical protein